MNPPLCQGVPCLGSPPKTSTASWWGTVDPNSVCQADRSWSGPLPCTRQTLEDALGNGTGPRGLSSGVMSQLF